MPKNRHFAFVNDAKEEILISKLKQEAIEIYGTNVYYIKRNTVDYNAILGEDLGQEFKDACLIVVYPESIENFGGNTEFMSKFGFSLQDTTNFLVHKREFIDVMKQYDYESRQTTYYPEVGDLIYWPETKRLFKITFVDLDYQFYQLGKNSIYQMQCEVFKYGSENIETNVEEIDVFDMFKNEDNIETDPADVDNERLIDKAKSIIVEE